MSDLEIIVQRIENKLDTQGQQIADLRVDTAKVSGQVEAISGQISSHLASDEATHAKLEAKVEVADDKAEKAQHTADKIQTKITAYAASIAVVASLAIGLIKSWLENTFMG